MKNAYSALRLRWVPRPLAALALLLATASAAHAQTPAATFASVATFSIGSGSAPTSIAVVDVNSDGQPDILTANFSGRGPASVLLNTGSGAFAPAVVYNNGSANASLAVADVNGDGQPDILLSGFTVAVFLNTGTGTFTPAGSYSTGTNSGTQGIAVADINGDGKPDLLTANSNSSAAGVLLGNGNGTFQPVNAFSTGYNSVPLSIAVADVNGDGKPDILTANNGSNTAGVLLNTGSGTFAPAVTYSTGPNSAPRGIAVADVNGDGQPDILTANPGSSTAGVLLGNGNGSFGAATAYSTGPNSAPRGIAVADVNGDGKPDILTANDGSGTAGVLLNTTVYAPPTPLPTLTFVTPTSAAVGASVTLTGTNLTGTTAVRFNGTAANSFVVNSATSLTAVVPVGATTGPITVTTPTGTATTSYDFVLRVPPTTVADAYSTPQNRTLTGNVLTNDLGTTPRAILIIQPTNGALALNPDGSFAYQPAAGYVGPDSFIYYACAPGEPLLCGNPVTVSITVVTPIPVPTVTLLNPSTALVGMQVTITGTNLSGATAVRFNGTAANSFVVNSATSLTAVVPAGATTGPITVTTPGGTATSPTSFVVRGAPITVADAYSTPQGTRLTGNVLTNDLGTNPQAILIIRPTQGTLVLNPNGSFSYQPAAGYTGPDSFIYYACNMGTPLVCGDPVTVSITVTPATGARVATSARPAATTLVGAASEVALMGSPNPFAEQVRLTFALPITQAYSLAVYDAQGHLVQQLARGQAEAGQTQQLDVPTASFATGLYLVRLTTATGSQLLKLVKY